MNKPVKIVLIGNAEIAFNQLNLIVEQQIKEDKNNSQEIQLLNSIKQKEVNYLPLTKVIVPEAAPP